MSYDTTKLLDSIKRGVTVPANQARFTDEDILALADEEIESTILPVLLAIRQEFLVKYEDVPLVAEQSDYKIPYRAVGRKLRDLKLIGDDETFIRQLPYIAPEDSHIVFPVTSGQPTGFTVRGENIVLLPTPSSADANLRMYYELAPSKLTIATSYSVTSQQYEINSSPITAINTTTGEVTVSTALTGYSNGDDLDFIDGNTAHQVKGEGVTSVSAASTVYTFAAADLPSNLAVGDILAFPAQTPVVQLPDELIQSLVQATICRLLEAQGDFDALDRSVARLEKKLNAAAQLLTPRVEGILPVVINRQGLLSQRPRIYRLRQ